MYATPSFVLMFTLMLFFCWCCSSCYRHCDGCQGLAASLDVVVVVVISCPGVA